MDPTIKISIVYAQKAHHAYMIDMDVAENATIEEAIQQSGILKKYPEISLENNKVGIYGQLCSLDMPLNHKDRIEIYRPLIADPKLMRRKKSQKA